MKVAIVFLAVVAVGWCIEFRVTVRDNDAQCFYENIGK